MKDSTFSKFEGIVKEMVSRNASKPVLETSKGSTKNQIFTKSCVVTQAIKYV